MRKIFLPVFFVWFFLFFPSFVIASSISLSSSQSQITNEEEFVVDFSLSINASDGTTYYLRGEFYRPNTSNYCGYTWNSSSWFAGPYTTNNGWLNLLGVTVASNSASGQMRSKIDLNDSACNSSGAYNFRIQRYTLSGNPSSDDETAVGLNIIVFTPTPAPTNTPTSTPTLTPNPTAAPTKTPIPSPTKSPTPKPTVTSITTPTSSQSASGQTEELVLGIQNSTPTPETLIEGEVVTQKKFPVFPVILIVTGFFCIVGSLFFFIKNNVKRGDEKEDT